MQNYKVRVNNELESEEVRGLFEQLGFSIGYWTETMHFPYFICSKRNGMFSNYMIAVGFEEELTIPQLRDLVVLHCNSVNDSTHTGIGENNEVRVFISSNGDRYFWNNETKKWLSEIETQKIVTWIDLKEVELKTIPKEKIPYLVKTIDKWEEQELTSDTPESATCLKIPDGAIELVYSNGNNSLYHFINLNGDLMSVADILDGKECWYKDKLKYKNWDSVNVVWQCKPTTMHTRCATVQTHPEELPFIDDEPKHDDNVNHPSHYTQGSIECIEALEAATVDKQGIEAVCVANVIKYLWRYEEKNGLEDVKKAKWYLEKLLSVLENK